MIWEMIKIKKFKVGEGKRKKVKGRKRFEGF